MFFFRKPPQAETPPQVTKLRQETHDAATKASKELTKLNSLMSNGITLKIYLATGGHHDE